MTYDVIIVGASYAGLATAIALRGRRVLLIDRYPVGAHQMSACGTLLAVVEALGLEHTVHQVHSHILLRFPGRRFEYPLAYPLLYLRPRLVLPDPTSADGRRVRAGHRPRA